MAKLLIPAGQTSVTVYVFIQDSSVTTGAGLTGLTNASAGLSAWFVTPRQATTQIVLVNIVNSNDPWVSGGFKEIDTPHMPGWYRLDLPNALLTPQSQQPMTVGISLKGAANMVPCNLEIQLQAGRSVPSPLRIP